MASVVRGEVRGEVRWGRHSVQLYQLKSCDSQQEVLLYEVLQATVYSLLSINARTHTHTHTHTQTHTHTPTLTHTHTHTKQ